MLLLPLVSLMPLVLLVPKWPWCPLWLLGEALEKKAQRPPLPQSRPQTQAHVWRKPAESTDQRPQQAH